MTKPLGYMDMICLLNNAKFVITDSGGVQEETTVLGVPCLTMRRNTERPVTVKIGTNIVVNGNKGKIVKEVKKIMAGRAKKGGIPKYWDGNTAERIVRILMENINLIA